MIMDKCGCKGLVEGMRPDHPRNIINDGGAPAVTQAPTPPTKLCSTLKPQFCQRNGRAHRNKTSPKTERGLTYPSDAKNAGKVNACCTTPTPPPTQAQCYAAYTDDHGNPQPENNLQLAAACGFDSDYPYEKNDEGENIFSRKLCLDCGRGRSSCKESEIQDFCNPTLLTGVQMIPSIRSWRN
jgi:ferredoxin-like protein FixX